MRFEHVTQGEADEFALGVLEPEEQRRIAEHALTCEECRTRLLDAQRVAAMLALAPGLRPPPPRLKQRVMEAAGVSRRRAWLPRLARLSPIAAAAAAVVLAAAAFAAVVPLRAQIDDLRQENGRLQSQIDDALGQRVEIVALTHRLQSAEASAWEAQYEAQMDREMLLALLSPESDTAEVISVAEGYAPIGRLIWDGDQNRLFFVASRLPRLPDGLTYELWVNVDGEYRSLGTFNADSSGFARFVRYLPEGLASYESAVVTVERVGEPGRHGPGVFFVADLRALR